MTYKRYQVPLLERRLREPRGFLQVLAGPRQTGKTTVARQVVDALRPTPAHYATADEPSLKPAGWIETQWDLGRQLAREASRRSGAVLVLDEIQKLPGWSETVKRLWDEDGAARVPLKAVILGSSPLLIQSGLTESLAGRFELIPVTHWSFAEMREAFGWTPDRFIYFGGYPGAAALTADRERWARYILDSIIETTVSRDILLMTRVDKPALLRQLFHLACQHSGQILSYTKMLGQLHDAGNTTTLAHYLELLSGAGMVTGLRRFAGQAVHERRSSPKLQVLNTALMTSGTALDPAAARRERPFWGRLVESAVGAHLVGGTAGTGIEVFYWRERGREVDFVLRHGRTLVAIEVKSGRARESLPGMEAFARAHRRSRRLLVGGDGIPLEEFLASPVTRWLAQ